MLLGSQCQRSYRTPYVLWKKKYMMPVYGACGPGCLIEFDLRFNFERENKILYKLHLCFNISSRQTFICSGIYMFCALILATNTMHSWPNINSWLFRTIILPSSLGLAIQFSWGFSTNFADDLATNLIEAAFQSFSPYSPRIICISKWLIGFPRALLWST